MRLHRILAALTVIGLLFAGTASAQHYDFREITLDNGLRVVTLEDFSTPIVAAQVWYHVGSKNEDPNRQGFAHLFEHLMFRGTDRLGPKDHFEYIQRVGGNANAFTSFDYTAYVNAVPSNQLELVLWLEAERMMYLDVDQESFVTERQVVKEERRQDLNEPYGTVAEKVLPVVFKELPYKWTPIGRIPHLEAADVSEVQAFWNTFYVPDNAVLVIVGAVKHEDAQALAKRYFGWMPKCPEPPRVTAEEPPQTEPREAVLDETQGPVPLAGYIWPGVAEEHPDYQPLEVLMGVLGYGESSRLYLDLVKTQKVASQVMADIYGFEKAGVFGAGASLEPGADIDKVLGALQQHLERVVSEPVTEREMTKVKNQLLRSLVTDQLTVENKARLLGEATVVHDDPNWLNEQIERIQKVTVEDMQRVAKQYIVPERRSTICVLPKPGAEPAGEAVAPDTIAQTRELEPSDCKDGVERPEDFPTEPPTQSLLDEIPPAEMAERTLSNGLQVVVVPNREVPFVSAFLGNRFGAWAEPEEHAGAASMAMDMLTKGTETYTADELADIVEFNALTLGGGASMDVSSVSATALADKVELALRLMAEVARRPTFPESEFDLLKKQLIVSLSIREKDPNFQADRALRRAIWGEHPYSRTVTGDLADVQELPLSAAKEWWKMFIRPDASILYVAGDVQPERMFELAEAYFGDWKAEGALPDPVLPEIPGHKPTQVYLVDNPGAVQSQIRVGQSSITRGHPYYHNARVFTEIFGGSFGSRLNDVIRVQRGLTYGAGGGFSPARFSGTFFSHTFTKTATTAETVQALIDVIESMRTNPPSDQELATAKSYLVGSFPSQLETPQDRVSYQWIIDYNGLPDDYLNQAVQGYKKTTPEELKHVADEIVEADKLAIVVVGDAKAIQADLEKIAPVNVVAAAPQAAQSTPTPAEPVPPAPQPEQPAPDSTTETPAPVGAGG